MAMTVIEDRGRNHLFITAPDIRWSGSVLDPATLTATFPGVVQTANGSYTGEDAVTSEPAGEPVHLGSDGWMVGQSGCVRDVAEVQNGGAGVDMPDVSWCGLNDWIGRNPLLAALGLAALFWGTRGAANRIRARRAR